MKVALLVGIDAYPRAPLSGCIGDVNSMHEVLSRNDDGSPNFSCFRLVSSEQQVTRPLLRENLEKLFAFQGEVALLFFAGHGYLSGLGGYLVTQDTTRYDEGISMTDVLALANRSHCREVIIMLDCCHSGAFGLLPIIAGEQAVLREGLAVLCASRATEAAVESNGAGRFTSLACEGLSGGAASLTGDVTLASLYSFVQCNMGVWEQRPLFKANLSRLAVLRRCDPRLQVSILQMLPHYFDGPHTVVTASLSNAVLRDVPAENARSAHFRAFRREALIKTLDGAAFESNNPVALTALGRYYWQLAKQGIL